MNSFQGYCGGKHEVTFDSTMTRTRIFKNMGIATGKEKESDIKQEKGIKTRYTNKNTIKKLDRQKKTVKDTKWRAKRRSKMKKTKKSKYN